MFRMKFAFRFAARRALRGFVERSLNGLWPSAPHSLRRDGCAAGARGKAAKQRTKPLDRSRQTCESGAMAKFRSSYVCQNCGAITQRWQGKCESCGEWNTIIEEAAALGVGGRGRPAGSGGSAVSP